jgi:hypothetical protein
MISGPLPFRFFNTAGAESTHDLLVSYAAKDSDNDGLPDWEEALYGTDPNNPHSVNQTATDGEAVAQGLVAPKFANATTTTVSAKDVPGVDAKPQTITEEFSRTLFADYISKRGAKPPTPAEIEQFVVAAVGQLRAAHQVANAFNQGQVHVEGTGPDALRTYAVDAQTAFLAHPAPAGSDMLDDLVAGTQHSDAAALKRLGQDGVAYAAIARDLMKISVPKEAATAHLALANSLMLLSGTLTDLSVLESDPVRSMIGIENYGDQADAFTQSLVTLYGVYAAEQVEIFKGEPGSHFFGTLIYARDSTAASKSP